MQGFLSAVAETTKAPSISVDALTVRYSPPSVLYIDVEGYEC